MLTGRQRLLAVATSTAATLGASAPAAMADTAHGLLAGGTKLTTFDTAAPNQQAAPVTITGLQDGETVVGIDVRPADGVLYGIGKAGTQGRLLKLDPVTGAATAVGVLRTSAPADVVLQGTEFDIDFNPAADRLRVVSDADQNLRIAPSTGVTIVDGPLAFAGGDPNAGDDPQIGHAAYTNSFAGTTTTTLYDVDAGNDVLVTQVPPNNGTLNTVGSLGMGVDVTSVGGFDIIPGSNRALALATANGTRRIFEIDLTTGAATARSGVIGGAEPLVDLAVAAKDTVTLLGLATPASGPQQLLAFRSDTPETVSGVVDVSGLAAGETLVGIDSRPRTGQVYGVGSAGRLYTLDPASGIATPVANGQISVALDGTRFGVDFNPAADRLRIVSDTGQNLRVNVDNAAGMGGTTVDGPLPAGDIVHAAYTNSVSDTATTQLQYVDSTSNGLLATTDANNPLMTTSPFGTAVGMNVPGDLQVDITDRGGYDIVGPFNRRIGAFATTGAPDAFRLYTLGAEGGLNSEAKAITTGAIAVPAGAQLDGITALVGDTVRLGSATVSVTEDGGPATVSIVREGALDGAVTVGYATGNGSAAAGADYTATSGTVTFAPGESVKTVSIPVTDDPAVEGTETFAVVLTSTTNGARIGTPAIGAVSILDDEVPASTGTGPQGGAAPVVVTVNVPGVPPFAFVRAATDEIRLATLRSKGLLVRLYCTQECKVSGALTASGTLARRTGRTVATLRSTTVPAGTVRLVRLKLTSKARRALGARSVRSASLRLPLRVTAPSGATTNVAPLTVRAFR